MPVVQGVKIKSLFLARPPPVADGHSEGGSDRHDQGHFWGTREGTSGYRRIQVVLERRGVRASGSTIRAIMRDLGLQAAGPRAKVRTTVLAQNLDECPDLVQAVLPPHMSPARNCAGIFPRKREVPLLRQDVGWVH